MSSYLTRLVARMTPDLSADAPSATTIETQSDAPRVPSADGIVDPFEAAIEEDAAVESQPTSGDPPRPQPEAARLPTKFESPAPLIAPRVEPSTEAGEPDLSGIDAPLASLPASDLTEVLVTPRSRDDEPRTLEPEAERIAMRDEPPPAIPVKVLPTPHASVDAEADENAEELAESLARMDQFMSQFTAARNVLDRLQARADETPDLEDHLTADIDDSAPPFAPVVRTLEPLPPAENAEPVRSPMGDDVTMPRVAVSIGEIRVEVGRDIPNPPVRRASPPNANPSTPTRPPSKRRFGIGQM